MVLRHGRLHQSLRTLWSERRCPASVLRRSSCCFPQQRSRTTAVTFVTTPGIYLAVICGLTKRPSLCLSLNPALQKVCFADEFLRVGSSWHLTS
uniref:Uncharacterized protein n=1 Tax=Knipowitschia caucasica TaxID=637954 RepID=A0AAV2JX60_KNICA